MCDNNITSFDTSNSEEKEVDEVKWICLDDIDKYNWAFNHNELLKLLKSELETFKFCNNE